MIYEVTTATLGPLHLDHPSKSKPITPYGIVSRTSQAMPCLANRTAPTPNRQPRFPSGAVGPSFTAGIFGPVGHMGRGVKLGRSVRLVSGRAGVVRGMAGRCAGVRRCAGVMGGDLMGTGKLSGLRRGGLTGQRVRALGPASGRYYGEVPPRESGGSRGVSPPDRYRVTPAGGGGGLRPRGSTGRVRPVRSPGLPRDEARLSRLTEAATPEANPVTS
jgi:hypothetical protein